jgi:hypothetical protein
MPHTAAGAQETFIDPSPTRLIEPAVALVLGPHPGRHLDAGRTVEITIIWPASQDIEKSGVKTWQGCLSCELGLDGWGGGIRGLGYFCLVGIWHPIVVGDKHLVTMANEGAR